MRTKGTHGSMASVKDRSTGGWLAPEVGIEGEAEPDAEEGLGGCSC